MNVAGLVLAAGRSERLGASRSKAPSTSEEASFKLLLPYGSMTVVEAAVRAPIAAHLSPVIVVVGHRGNEVRQALRGLRARVQVVDNPAWENGQSSSVAAGVQVVQGRAEVDGVAVLLADEPGMRPEWIQAAVRAWSASGADVARAVYADRPGHPVVFGRSMFEALCGLRDDSGAASLLRDARHAVCKVRIGSPAPVDVDTERDYREALQRRAKGNAPE